MKTITMLCALVALVGCTTPGTDEDVDTETLEANLLVYPVDALGFLEPTPVALFNLRQERRWVDDEPDRAKLYVTMTSVSEDIVSFNFRLSGLQWQFTNAAVFLEPGETIDFGVVTTEFDALDEYWLTLISPVSVTPTGPG